MMVWELTFLREIHKVYFPYEMYLPEKLHRIIYLSIGKKHGNLKLLINCWEKSYRIFVGTRQIAYSYDLSATLKQLAKQLIQYDKS